jgi:hypothetical protein
MLTRERPPFPFPDPGADDPIPDPATIKLWLTRTLRLAALLKRQLRLSRNRAQLDAVEGQHGQ